MADEVRVLAVDDDEAYRDLVRCFLEKDISDVEVDTYSDPEEALEQGGFSEYDLVVSDWNMPRMDGGDFGQELRKVEPDIPIIYFSSEDQQDVEEAVLSLQARFLDKRDYDCLSDNVMELVEQNGDTAEEEFTLHHARNERPEKFLE